MAKNDTTLEAAIQAANNSLGNTAVASSATVDTVEAKAARHYNELELKRKNLVSKYREEKKVPVTISPFYAPYLGKVVRVSVNGIIVDIPADGQTYSINKTHAIFMTVLRQAARHRSLTLLTKPPPNCAVWARTPLVCLLPKAPFNRVLTSVFAKLVD